MENFMRNENLKNLVKGVLATAVVSALLIACKPKNDEVLPVNAYTKNCLDCAAAGITGFPFFTAQTQALKQGAFTGGYSSGYSTAMTVNWSFSGQNLNTQVQGQSQQGQTYYQYSSPAMSYVGKVSAAGKVEVAAPLNLGFCPAVPAGTYELSTQTLGQWTNGQITGLKILIFGPVTMTATLSQGQASEYSYGYQYSAGSSRVYGNLIVEQVNGYYCQSAQFYLN